MQNRVELLSQPNPHWHFRASWMHLLQAAEVPHPPWKMVLLGQEIRCRIMDGLGYLDMATRVLTYIIGYQAGYLPARFRTTSRLAGLIVDLDDGHSKQIGEGLAKLGAPVWRIHLLNRKPRHELLPQGATEDSDVWKEAYEQERPSVCIRPDPAWLIE